VPFLRHALVDRCGRHDRRGTADGDQPL